MLTQQTNVDADSFTHTKFYCSLCSRNIHTHRLHYKRPHMIPHSMFTSVASSKKTNWLRLQYPKFQNWKDNNEFPSNKKNKQTEQASAALKFYNLIHSICMYACFCSHHWVRCCYAIRCHVWPQNRSLVCSFLSFPGFWLFSYSIVHMD